MTSQNDVVMTSFDWRHSGHLTKVIPKSHQTKSFNVILSCCHLVSSFNEVPLQRHLGFHDVIVTSSSSDVTMTSSQSRCEVTIIDDRCPPTQLSECHRVHVHSKNFCNTSTKEPFGILYLWMLQAWLRVRMTSLRLNQNVSCRDTHKRRESTKRRVNIPTLHGNSKSPCVSKTNKISSGPIFRDINLNFDAITHGAILNNHTEWHNPTYRISCSWLFHPTLHLSESIQLEDIDMQLPTIDPHWVNEKLNDMPLPYLGSPVSEIFEFFWFLHIFHNSYSFWHFFENKYSFVAKWNFQHDPTTPTTRRPI